MTVAAKDLQIPDSGATQRLHVRAGSCCVQGARRDKNEDREFVSPSHDLFVVADGMGGHAAGEVASRFAVDVVSHELSRIENNATNEEIEQRVRAALDRAHCMIVDTTTDEITQSGAGTTVVLALLRNHRLYVAGVGDSRAYLIRHGKIKRLTADDTWPDTLFRMGRISVDQARKHYMRHYLMTALGMQQFQAQQEEIQILDVYAGDRFLLASDGLTDNVPDSRLLEIIGRCENPQEATEELVYVARAEGGGDDVTCIVFSVSDGNPASTFGPRVDRAQSASWWRRLTSVIRGAL